jgi:3-phenylpropionate/trans-cinnamate dioxygenase ferredoxin subunit
MTSFKVVAKVGELGDGTMKKLIFNGQEILLARVGGNYYAASNLCPHMNGDLSRGKLDGTIVTCPRHASRFDLRDGSMVRWLKGSGLLSALGKTLKSPRPLKTYPTTIEGDSVLIDI